MDGTAAATAGEGALSDVLIDLGELPAAQRDAPAAAAPAGRPPRSYRTALAGVTVLLTLLVAGGVHRPPPPPPVVLAAPQGDMTFVADGRLFLVGDRPTGEKIIRAYALPSVRPLSTTAVAVRGTVFDVRAAGHVVLVSYQTNAAGGEATVAVAAGTGRVLWRHRARLLAVSAAAGLALLRENSPNVGDLHWYAIDLATGGTRWSLQQPPRGVTTEAGNVGGFPARLVSATDTGRLEVRDAVTGAVTARADVAPPAEWRFGAAGVWPVGDLVLIGGRAGTVAYALADLTERWRSTADLSQRFVLPDCADAICLFGRFGGGVQVLDPATGRRRWDTDRWAYAEQAGPYLLATGNADGDADPPLAVLDPATGRVRGTFGAWQAAGEIHPDGTFVGVRQPAGAPDDLWYALLDPATLGVRVLGSATGVSGGCAAVDAALVCRRVDASVGIWQLTGP
jgi:hypothetical protein